MDVTLVDPRDVEWETDAHSYRVYFWSPDGGTSDEYEVTGASDVGAVLAWAADRADGRLVEVFAYLVCDGAPGLLRLAGGRPDTAQVALALAWHRRPRRRARATVARQRGAARSAPRPGRDRWNGQRAVGCGARLVTGRGSSGAGADYYRSNRSSWSCSGGRSSSSRDWRTAAESPGGPQR